MEALNARFNTLLDRAFDLIEPLGPTVAIAAWMTVFGGSIGLGVVLRSYPLRRVRLPAVAVGAVSLVAHLLDYAVTLRISPDLGAEANPVWRIVIERWGLGTAKAYGLSGKILLAILSFEFFAFYLLQRGALFPDRAMGFFDFWRRFGKPAGPDRLISWRRMANFFAFSFAWLGPFYFYVALLNSLADSPAYDLLPAMPVVLVAYVALLTSTYLGLTYRAFKRRA